LAYGPKVIVLFSESDVYLMSTHVDFHKGTEEVSLMWTNVYGGSKAWFSCGRHRWMTP